jgi:hypothetical protein
MHARVDRRIPASPEATDTRRAHAPTFVPAPSGEALDGFEGNDKEYGKDIVLNRIFIGFS